MFPLTPAPKDVIASLVATVIWFGLGWLAATLRARALRRRGERFFCLGRGSTCRVIVGQYREHPAVAAFDVGAIIETLATVQPFQPTVESPDSSRIMEAAGDVTEFCIGGPDSNQRTAAHLAEYLGGIEVRSYEEDRALRILTKSNSYVYSRGKQVFVVLARIHATTGSRPVFLVCGQNSLSNRAAIYYLRKNRSKVLQRRFGYGQFCLILGVSAPSAFGYKMAELVEDVTDTAFLRRGPQPNQRLQPSAAVRS